MRGQTSTGGVKGGAGRKVSRPAADASSVGTPAEGAAGVVRASRVEIVDDRGQARAQLGVGPDDSVSLALFDAAGRLSVQVGCDHRGGGVVAVLDADGTYRGALALYPQSSPVLEFYDAAGKLRAQLGITDEGQQRLRFHDPDRASVVELGMDSDGRLSVIEGAPEIAEAQPVGSAAN